MDKIKQVIIIRKDLGMRKGKMIAQGAHAAMANLLRIQESGTNEQKMMLSQWLSTAFTKITLSVNSEKELKDLHERLINRGLVSELIIDNGDTEFNGVKTPTCLCIGPDLSSVIDPFTKELKLL